MQDLPDVSVVDILSALPYTQLTAVLCVCRKWHELRASEPYRAARAAMDERYLVVSIAVGRQGPYRCDRHCEVLVDGRWRERTPLPHDFIGSTTLFCGELIHLGCERPEGRQWSPCCRAFDSEGNAWRSLKWEAGIVWACCAIDAVVVTFSSAEAENRGRLRSLRPGSAAEGWVSIPHPLRDVLSIRCFPPSLCCVEDVLYIVGGEEGIGAVSDALQAFDLSSRRWTVRAPLPEPRCNSMCVELAGSVYAIGGSASGSATTKFGRLRAEVFSYDPRADRWRSEAPLPLEEYGAGSQSSGADLGAVSHKGRVVVIGIRGAPPLALVNGVWTELPPLPPHAVFGTALSAHLASIRLG